VQFKWKEQVGSDSTDCFVITQQSLETKQILTVNSNQAPTETEQ